jgi:hypothetical protein
MVGREELQQQGGSDEEQRHQMTVDVGDQLADLAHGGDIGADIEGVGDQQQDHHQAQHDRWEGAFDVFGQTLTRDPTDPSAQRLDGRHQRIGERYRPEHVEPELSAGLGVGGDAARVVVSHAGDQTGPDPGERVG